MGTITVSGRDLALMRAVAAGRCQLGDGIESVLLVDGMVCADFSAGHRLVTAGFVAPPDPARPLAPASLTSRGRETLGRPAA